MLVFNLLIQTCCSAILTKVHHKLLNKPILFANPITEDGNSYGRFIDEEDAFLWFDEALLYVRAGSGGTGSSAVKFGPGRQHRYPTGGSGGTGGNIILVADSKISTLLGFRGQSHFRAENGADGDKEYCNGKCGQDLYISVPKGTIIKDNETNIVLGELNFLGDKLLVAKGGYGGKGNAAFKTGIEKAVACPPQGGEKKWLKIELKLVADIGLVGLPNAGKSTLLGSITNARPKIASYAFTTIVPNLGVCDIDNSNLLQHEYEKVYDQMVIADIPGLIEGAHLGRGLGRGFLRHVERCKILIHLIDCTRANPVHDYLTINQELLLFSNILANKPQIVVLNKIDRIEDKSFIDSLVQQFQKILPHKRLLVISASDRLGTKELVSRTYSFLRKVIQDEEKLLQSLQSLQSQKSILKSSSEEDYVIEVDDS
jgi:GTP-binding protein